MEEYIEIFSICKLFEDINEDQIINLLKCLNGRLVTYTKGEFICREDDIINYTGIVLDGRIEISKDGIEGNKSIIDVLETADIFGEVIASTGAKKSIVNVVAIEETKIVFIDFNKILYQCSNNCNYHTRLISNMLKIIAEKNITLNKKLELLMIKSMRERLSYFLYSKYKEHNSLSFVLNFNRGEMAQYLNLSRPSMCRELSRMKEEGIIDYYKNSFKILDMNLLREKK